MIYILALFLVLAGLFVPSLELIQVFRAIPTDKILLRQLIYGAALFRLGLVALGAFVVLFGRNTAADLQLEQKQINIGASNKSIAILLTFLLILAAVLRLYQLDRGLWYDEIRTYVNYASRPIGEIITTYGSENQHPLYTILAHASLCIFGEGAWSLRLPAALLGVGSIGGLYLLGRQVANAREALLSAALLSFSYYHIWFSQNARGYTGLLFWTVLSSWLLLRALRKEKLRTWIFYAGATAMGVYTHITMLFVIAGHLVVSIIAGWNSFRRPQWIRVFFGFGMTGLFTFQLYALVMPQFLSRIGEDTRVLLWKSPLWTVLELIRGTQVSFASTLAAIVALFVFSLGLLSLARDHSVIVPLLLFPTMLGSAVVLGMGHPLWPRFFFFALGFVTLVAVRGTMKLGEIAVKFFRSNVNTVSAGTVFCGILILFSALTVPSAYGPKQDYDGALAFLEQNQEPGDAIITIGVTTFPYQNFYKKNWQTVKTLDSLRAVRQTAKRTWLVYAFPVAMQYEYPEIMGSIERDFKMIRRFGGTLKDGTIFVCRSDRSTF